MERRALGSTGLQITPLGLGAAGIANLYRQLTDDEAVEVVRAALDRGIRYVDTALLYGKGASERRIGLALAGHPWGAECVVATKIGYVPEGFDYSFDATVRSVEASRERLGLSRIPIVQIHEIRPEIWDAVMAPAGALAALRKLRADGTIGHLGVTGSDLDTLRRAIDTREFETVFIWRHFHLLDDSGRSIIDEAGRRGLGVLIGTPFAGGILASGSGPEAKYFYQPASEEIQTRVRAIEHHCQVVGVSLRAAALRFCLEHPAVSAVIAGADSPTHVAQNVSALHDVYPANETGEQSSPEHPGITA